MKELNIFDMKKISGGYLYRMRPVSSNVVDMSAGWGKSSFWNSFRGIFPKFGENLPNIYQ
ncbi:hypothetical protein [Neisseria dentiae]|uniref:hypothetical protein n=1 Tax=Neisseria dentiae TaxID=194197 RepID=UPI000A18A91B|nr:hypothetical protein [Neisseria dentiae]QMT45723.1 hypothetical protein H3L92_02600 [Neisseria dentiae]STZ51691.1 Uncharacterised protein [Neisseria dentiae]